MQAGILSNSKLFKLYHPKLSFKPGIISCRSLSLTVLFLSSSILISAAAVDSLRSRSTAAAAIAAILRVEIPDASAKFYLRSILIQDCKWSSAWKVLTISPSSRLDYPYISFYFVSRCHMCVAIK